jgi:oxygen-independent coproporphyrinogen-3 oxidase
MGRVQKTVGLLGEKQEVGVYAHVPFCKRKCPYCDFKSIEAARAPEERFAGCLTKELEKVTAEEGLQGALLSTLYLGGGTPSILSPNTVANIVNSIKSFFRPAEDLEVTIEVNPDTVDLEKLAAFRGGGVTRLSIGFQALDDRHLVLLGRAHTAEASLKAFSLAREVGFTNVGVDLMFAIPGQTLADWETALRRVCDLGPEHISLYGLTVEEGTPFHGRYGKGREGLPSDEIEARMYLMAREALMKAGYSHYEVSNFALPGFESAHNSRYWNGADYIGIGPSAHSYLSRGWGRRWWNIPGPYEYMERVEKGESPVEAAEALTRTDAMLEAVMLGLRMVEEGLKGGPFTKRFGLSPVEAFIGWDGLITDGLVDKRGQDLVLTEKGLLFLNEILLKLTPVGL